MASAPPSQAEQFGVASQSLVDLSHLQETVVWLVNQLHRHQDEISESFIKANHALFACYEATPNEEYQAMAKPAQQALCQAEKAAVAQFLKDDSVHFR